jgi:hypothetical protein
MVTQILEQKIETEKCTANCIPLLEWATKKFSESDSDESDSDVEIAEQSIKISDVKNYQRHHV